MTAYFDERHAQVRTAAEEYAATSNWSVLSKRLDEIDNAIVFDVTVCSEMPDFPDDLRTKIHEAVITHSFASLPVNCRGRGIDCEQEQIDGVHKLIWELHTIFHHVAQRRLAGFTDSPTAPLRILYARGEERREAMVPLERRIGDLASEPAPETAPETALESASAAPAAAPIAGTPCNLCGQPTQDADLCPDGNCRACHKSLTFEECCDGSWVRAQRKAAGLPVDEGKDPAS